MFTSEFTAAILFVQQVGLALAGAACLWGLYFFFNARNTQETGEKTACDTISGKLFFPYVFGFVIAFVGWLFKSGSDWSFIEQSRVRAFLRLSSGTQGILNTITVLWIFLFALTIVGVVLYRRKRGFFQRFLNLYFVVAFITIFILISFPTGIEKYDIDRLFFIKHGFPLIFTFGTVIVLDFLFFFTRPSLRLKRQIYPHLPTLNKMIWIGLGMSFLWEWNALDPALLTPLFFFIQTVIGIMIINGMLFNGPLMQKLVDGVSERHVKPLGRGWIFISEISGVITFSCWSTITLASFANFDYSYKILLIAFVVKTVAVYLILLFIEYITERPMTLVGTH